MNAKQKTARRVRQQITAHDNYRLEIKNLISIYEPCADAGLVPREYIDALHNCLDVTEKEPHVRNRASSHPHP